MKYLRRPDVDWRGLVAHPPAWLGRRGAILLALGLIWIGFGLNVPTEIDQPETAIIAHQLIPTPVRIALWVVTGLLAIAGATIDRPRWEKWGYMALILMAAERCVSFFLSWLVWLGCSVVNLASRLGLASWSEVDYGYERGFANGLIWLGICFVLYTVAGWQESTRIERVIVAEAVAGAHKDAP